jgi:hypothetical protein
MHTFHVDEALLNDATALAPATGYTTSYASPIAEDAFRRFRSRGRGRLIAGTMAVTVVVATAVMIQTLLGGVSTMRVVAAAAFAATAVGYMLLTAAYVFFVARIDVAGDARLELVVARRQQRLTYLAIAGLTPFPALALNTWSQGCDANGFADVRCYVASYATVVVAVIVTTLIFRARPVPALIANTLFFGAYFAGGAVVNQWLVPPLTALDFATVAVVLVAIIAVFTLQSLTNERQERQHFTSHVVLRRSQAMLAIVMQSTQRLLRAALPHQLLDDETHLAAMVHRSDCATVCVTDIHDFAQWSCGVLVNDVVLALHHMLTLCDVGASEFDVVRAVTHGDCCVVCAGLITTAEDHAGRVAAFAFWFINMVASSPSLLVSGLSPRASLCTGPLMGVMAGTDALRYVVVGPAYDTARRELLAAEPVEIVTNDLLSTRTSMAGALPVPPPAGQGPPPAASPADGPAAAASAEARDAVGYSRVSLRFRDPAVQNSFDAFVAEQENDTGGFTALAMPVIFGAFLAVLGLERLSEDARRHHSAPLPIAGIAVAFVCSGLIAVARLVGATRRLPARLVYVATALSISVGNVALMFTGCVLAAPHTILIFVLGTPALFAQCPWPAQTAIQTVTVVLPSVLWTLFLSPFATEGEKSWELVVTVILLVAVKYESVSVSCVQHAAAVFANEATRGEVARAEQHRALLSGLLPAHVVPHAAITNAVVLPHYMQRWRNLSVLQVALHRGTAEQDFGNLEGIWAQLPALVVAHSEGMLEITEASGDSFMIAGPFRAQESRRRADNQQLVAALRAVAVLAGLDELVAGRSSFTAVATAGEAVGALLGASLLTFRLFGPAVRESNALLAAAPQTDAPVAFASEGFRQQYCNFAWHLPGKAVGATMSTTIGRDDTPSTATPEQIESQRLDRLSAVHLANQLLVGVGTPHGGTPPLSAGDEAVFADPSLWRVRGVGVSSISSVRFRH